MVASFKPSKDQSRALVNGNRLTPVHVPYEFKPPYNEEHFWVVKDDDYRPLPWEKKLELVDG